MFLLFTYTPSGDCYRYYAIVHPLSSLQLHSKSRTRRILAATWLLPILVATPYLFCKSYAFNITSDLGSISRQICNDRFDDIDVAMYGESMRHSGRFRKGYFLFLFVAIYLLPMIVIVTTCVRIALCLLKPIRTEGIGSNQGLRMTRRREESKRKVRSRLLINFHNSYIRLDFSMIKCDSLGAKFSKGASFRVCLTQNVLVGVIVACYMTCICFNMLFVE